MTKLALQFDWMLLGQNPADYSWIVVMVMIGVMFYFLIIRPEQKRRKEQEDNLNQLKKNDRVVTVGGILGTVVNVTKNDDEVVIRIDDNTNTKMHVLRSAISRIVSNGGSSDSK